MATMRSIMEQRDTELRNMGEGEPGEPGSTRSKDEAAGAKKKEAVKRARGDDDVRTRVDGKQYRERDIDRKTGALRDEE